MEDVDHWLKAHRHDCGEISPELKDAIADFVLVWSLFEHTTLSPANQRLHGEAIQRGAGYEKSNYDLVEDAARRGVGDLTALKAFQDAYSYHQGHYYDGAYFSDHLEQLIADGAQANSRIRGVFQNRTPPPHVKLAALLHVAYCLRTNLIHGYKWDTALQGQEANFRHATQVLMLAVDHPA